MVRSVTLRSTESSSSSAKAVRRVRASCVREEVPPQHLPGAASDNVYARVLQPVPPWLWDLAPSAFCCCFLVFPQINSTTRTPATIVEHVRPAEWRREGEPRPPERQLQRRA
ncbi:hypothetical protein TcCL_Unassigned04121 [Trypanosoma cruzi]|nr:hypothetical protein TcCL_Unassigned04121 [Trypanosoma cruzi]